MQPKIIINKLKKKNFLRFIMSKERLINLSLLFSPFFYLFIFYLFMAVLGPRFCARAFSSCGKWGPLFITARRPLTIAASPAAERRLQTRRLSNCGSRAQLLRGTRDPPRPGPKPASPALAGRLPTTAPPGKPSPFFNNYYVPGTYVLGTWDISIYRRGKEICLCRMYFWERGNK